MIGAMLRICVCRKPRYRRDRGTAFNIRQHSPGGWLFSAYKSLVKRRRKSNVAPLQLAFCLAHARRKFVEVVKTTGSSEALAIIATIAEIYRVEERVRGMSAEERLSVRKAESAPLMAALKERLEMLIDEARPSPTRWRIGLD